jgi:hypothetical protein
MALAPSLQVYPECGERAASEDLDNVDEPQTEIRMGDGSTWTAASALMTPLGRKRMDWGLL